MYCVLNSQWLMYIHNIYMYIYNANFFLGGGGGGGGGTACQGGKSHGSPPSK